MNKEEQYQHHIEQATKLLAETDGTLFERSRRALALFEASMTDEQKNKSDQDLEEFDRKIMEEILDERKWWKKAIVGAVRSTRFVLPEWAFHLLIKLIIKIPGSRKLLDNAGAKE